MSYTEQLQVLRDSLGIKPDKQGLRHTINKAAPLLPFPTRKTERPKFARGFDGVTGELSRIISGKKLDAEVDIDAVIDNIMEQVSVNGDDKNYFIQLIRMFISDGQESMKVFHPYIFQYLPLTEGQEGKGESRIAHFFRDVFVKENDRLKAFFSKQEPQHLIAKLIMKHLDHLKSGEIKRQYHNMMPFISELFQEDIEFLMRHQAYFAENINTFLAYYYFFYITQLTLKLNQSRKANYDDVNEVIYTLDWEGASKSRSGYARGFQSIKDAEKNLLVHVNCLEHLNFLFGTIQTEEYGALEHRFGAMEKDEQNALLSTFVQWIGEYRYHKLLPPLENLSESYDELIEQLYQSLSEGLQDAPRSRFPLSIDAIGKKYFLKTRGSLGYMLNISQDFLLLLTTICVKDERKSLKEVFKEFEKRGIFLDRHSQELVVQLFDKLNILDKKSDSGDAQYVKPIL